jgi:hypothetical protein
MKTYNLRILDGTHNGYTEQVIATNLDITNGIYHFYKLTENGVMQTISGHAYYPVNRTIIESIVENN